MTKVLRIVALTLLLIPACLSAQTDSESYSKQVVEPQDTTLLNKVWDYAEYCYDQRRYEEAEKYYLIYKRGNTGVSVQEGAVCQNLGNLMCDMMQYDRAEAYYREALMHYDALHDDDQETFFYYISRTQGNLGILLTSLKKYDEAETFLIKSLHNRERLYTINPVRYRSDLAQAQDYLATLYFKTGDMVKSEKNYLKAIRHLSKIDRPTVEQAIEKANVQANLGILYKRLDRKEEAEAYCKDAIATYEMLYKVIPEWVRPDYATSLENLGNFYYELGLNKEAINCYNQAFELREILYKTNSDVYDTQYKVLKQRIEELASKVTTDFLPLHELIRPTNASLYACAGHRL